MVVVNKTDNLEKLQIEAGRIVTGIILGNTTNRKGHQITKIVWGRFVVNRIK
jgi:hypothetical protein